MHHRCAIDENSRVCHIHPVLQYKSVKYPLSIHFPDFSCFTYHLPNQLSTISTTMKLSTAAYAVLAFGAAQSAQAVDFDFRNFEGWWEATYPLASDGTTMNTLFTCGATGDWKKAVCEFTISVPSDANCRFGRPSVVSFEFMMSQFSADAGTVPADLENDAPLMTTVSCCDRDGTGCDIAPLSGYENPNITFEQLPGKSNKHVRAIRLTYAGDMGDENGRGYVVDLHRTGGGFKSLA